MSTSDEHALQCLGYMYFSIYIVYLFFFTGYSRHSGNEGRKTHKYVVLIATYIYWYIFRIKTLCIFKYYNLKGKNIKNIISQMLVGEIQMLASNLKFFSFREIQVVLLMVSFLRREKEVFQDSQEHQ